MKTVTGAVQLVNVPFGGGNHDGVRLISAGVILAVPLVAVAAVQGENRFA